MDGRIFDDSLEIMKSLLGFVITAAAVSSGTPFWFETLGMAPNLRKVCIQMGC